MNKINLATGIVFLFLKARGDIFKFVIVGEKIFCLLIKLASLRESLVKQVCCRKRLLLFFHGVVFLTILFFKILISKRNLQKILF